MANRETATGLSLGQLVTLTFGFLLASALIFAFGFWVGYDAAQRRLARDQQFVRLPVEQLPTRVPTPTAVPGQTEPPRLVIPTLAPVVTAAVTTPTLAWPTFTPVVVTPTASPRPPTATPLPRTPTRPPATAPALIRTAATGGEETGGIWTVQAGATTDPVQAVVLARRLRTKGFEAYTVTGKVDGVMWYWVRVGRFESRVQAKVLELRLKGEEGLQEAIVVRQ